jgi:hypothetical protein
MNHLKMKNYIYNNIKLGVRKHAYNPSTWEADAEEWGF